MRAPTWPSSESDRIAQDPLSCLHASKVRVRHPRDPQITTEGVSPVPLEVGDIPAQVFSHCVPRRTRVAQRGLTHTMPFSLLYAMLEGDHSSPSDGEMANNSQLCKLLPYSHDLRAPALDHPSNTRKCCSSRAMSSLASENVDPGSEFNWVS